MTNYLLEYYKTNSSWSIGKDLFYERRTLKPCDRDVYTTSKCAYFNFRNLSFGYTKILDRQFVGYAQDVGHTNIV
ncbi:MAG: hypothetical protein ACOYL1_07010 [Chlamydiia bacterium]